MGEKGKSGIVLVVAVLVLATAFAIWLRRREFAPAAPDSANSEAVKTVSPQFTPTLAKTQTHAAAASVPPPPIPVDPEFKKWLSHEALELNRVNVNGEEKRQQMNAVVAKITAQQSRQLLQTVTNPRAPAAEKILSAYLLVEGGSRTLTELSDLIAAPLVENPNFQPHSEEEMKGIREKSLKIMAIDGLFTQAQREPRAREALARAARETQDPTVRAYAEDKLRSLQ